MINDLIKNQINAVIDRFADDKAVIKTEDGQEITWPINNLSDNLAEGQAVKLIIDTQENEDREREAIAKNILNDILKIDDDTKPYTQAGA